MRRLTTLTILLFFSSVTFGQQQRKGFAEWVEAAKTNINMQPMYGHQQKSEGEIKADEDLLKYVLEKEKTKRAGSDHLVELGFDYTYQSRLQTAMSRFNQAWLLDSTNANVFWGFGVVYFYLRAYDEAFKMYNLGLQLDSTNTNIITDIGGTYLSMYSDDSTRQESLTYAISYLEKSYKLNPKYSSTVYKLIICSLYTDDCEKAKKYFMECEKLDRNLITNDFRKNFKQKCNL